MRGRNTRRHQHKQSGEETRSLCTPAGRFLAPGGVQLGCRRPAGTLLAHAELSKEKRKLGRTDAVFRFSFSFLFPSSKAGDGGFDGGGGWLKKQASLTLGVTFQNPAPPILSPFAAPTTEGEIKIKRGGWVLGA